MPDITGVRAVTNAVISPNIKIKIGQYTIGYIKQLTETEARPVAPIYEVGTVGIVEMVPGQPAPITLAASHIAIYGASFNNIIAKAIQSGDMSGISKAAGLSLEDTKDALKIWLSKRFGTDTMNTVFSLAEFPVGFEISLSEQSPINDNKQFITTYENCWVTRSTRPIVTTGDLLIVETADISAQKKTSKEGIPITADKVEVVAS